MSAEVIIALLGIAGTLVGWWVKRWWMKYDEKVKTEQRQAAEQTAADAHVKKAADETARINQSKQKQDVSADAWAKSQQTPSAASGKTDQ